MATTATDKVQQPQGDDKKNQQVEPKAHKPQRERLHDKLKIFWGTANEPLTDEICQFLGIQRGQAHMTRFSDGEVYLQILENVPGSDVVVLEPTCYVGDRDRTDLVRMRGSWLRRWTQRWPS